MTDVERDVQQALACVGKSNDYFKDIWQEFASGWDGSPCTEIACCISYMAGNLTKIYVANYAEALANIFAVNNRLDNNPKIGDFVFFSYGEVFPTHTGRVVDIKDGWLTVVEGNIDGKVVKRDYLANSYYFYGFGHPLYDVVDDTISVDEFVFNAVKDIKLYKDMQGCEHLVKMIQLFLKDLGMYNGTIDGVYGSFTESAVKRYQQTHNLVVDGWIGEYFWRCILND